MVVSQLLKEKGSQVFTVTKETSVGEITRLLATKRIGAVVVTDGKDSLEGIVSERDIIRGLDEFGPSVIEHPAKSLMTKNVITRDLDAHVEELMTAMTASRIRHLPIVSEGKLAGLISIGDVVKNRVQELESEGNMLREYISMS